MSYYALYRQRIITSLNDRYVTQGSMEGCREESRLAGRDMPVRSNAPDRQYDPGGGFVYRRIPYASSGTLAYGSDPNPTLLVNPPVKKHSMKRISSPLTVSQSLRTNTSVCMSMAVAGTRLPTPCWTALACPAS